ncbi:hypothetical protein [Paracoccus liaowanqingii]|nr:hypothetical protein [Paracoccus liaowanqingii]
MTMPVEYGYTLIAVIFGAFVLALNWWDDRQFERKHGKPDKGK